MCAGHVSGLHRDGLHGARGGGLHFQPEQCGQDVRIRENEGLILDTELNNTLRCLIVSENGGLADHGRVCNPLDGGRLEITSVQIHTSSDQRKES